MNRITLTLTAIVLSCATTLAQSQKLVKIDYEIITPQKSGESLSSGEIFLQGWVNKDFIRVSDVDATQALYITKKSSNTSFMLFPESEEYLPIADGTEEDESDPLPMKFVKGKQRKIAGYNCKLVQIKTEYDLEEGDQSTMEIWYTEDIPNLYWGEFSFLKHIPGAVLSLTVDGNGFQAKTVSTVSLDNSYFEIPDSYTEMEVSGDMEEVDLQVSENRFLFTDDSGSLYGLMDEEDNIILQPIYTYIGVFTGDAAVAINTEDKYGAIDADGKMILPFKYDYLSYDENSKQYLFGLNDKYGILNEQRKELVPAKYDMISFFSDGLSIVTQGELSGLIDLTQKIVVPIKYPIILEYNKDCFITVENGKYILHNITLKKQISVSYDFISLSSDNAPILAEKEGKFGYIDKNGKIVIPFIFTYANTFSNDMAAVAEDSEGIEIYYINSKGEKVNFEEN